MLAIIMIIEFLLLFLLFYRKNKDLRRSVIIASVLWGIILIMFTETLSILSWLTQRNLAIFWIISTIINMYLIVSLKCFDIQIAFKRSLDRNEKFIALIIILFIVGTFLNTILFPPRNWDSMTYHMARVANWAQNHSVHHYATNISRQLFNGVFAEFVILNTYILSGNDNLSNLVQWSYYIFSIIVVSAIVKKIGISTKGQLLASFLYASMPMVVMQASTTQNDLIAAYWTLAFVYFTLDLLKVEKLNFSYANLSLLFLLASCLGIGLLTKSTSCFALIPFLLWILIDILKKKNSIKYIPFYAIIAILIIILINFGYFSQNQKTDGSILASSQKNSLVSLIMVDTISPKLLITNVLKNTFMELDFDFKDQYDNKTVEHFALNVLKTIQKKLEINVDDPSISYQSMPFALVTGIYNEDVSGNHWLILLSIISILLIIIRLIIIRRVNISIKYSIISIFSFIILSIVLKWQPWITRLLTPSLVLLSLVPVIAIEEFISHGKWKRVLTLIVVIFISIGSIQPLLLQSGQPLLLGGFLNAREIVPEKSGQKILKYLDKYIPASETYSSYKEDPNSLYFYNRMNEYTAYKNLINYVKENDFKEIGIIVGEDTYEYPLWIYLKTSETEIKHINVSNISKIYEDPSFIPECIIVINNDFYNGSDNVKYHNKDYVKAYVQDKDHYLYVQKSIYSAPIYHLGETIELNAHNKYQKEGWTSPEYWGAWTNGEIAKLHMNIKSKDENLFLHLDIGDIFTSGPIEIFANDQLLGEYQLLKGNNSIQIPKDILSMDGNINIDFKIKDPKSPKSLGLSNDERKLGIGVKGFSITNSQYHTPLYHLGEVIELNEKSNYQTDGWAYPEKWGTWTDGEIAKLHMSFDNENNDLLMHLDIGEMFNSSPIEVLVNNHSLGSYKFSKGDNTINIPKSALSSDGNVNIEFKIEKPQSPKSLGVSNDDRKLGFGVKRFSITYSK